MKTYYSCLDTGFVKYVPQPLQHLAISTVAEGLGGKIVFYTSEDFNTLASQGSIKSKLQQKGETVDGVIFFTLRQFFYSGGLNVKFLEFILDRGLEVHFARENMSIANRQDLDELFPILYATEYVTRRDQSEGLLSQVIS